MSWSIEEHIGEGGPWPEQVVVYRGETDESLTYARRSLSDVNKMVELMDTLAAENAKLREQMERLVTLLRNDCDIEASWDGLRHFWSIELTDDGCLMRDRACKAEAENARLREQVDAAHMSRLLTENENEELRELARDVWHLFTEHGAVNPCDLPVVDAVRDRMRELRVEVDE